MPPSRRPIGVFDSGVGGLTVLKALRAALPQEAFVYFGDTARVPYGGKSAETVTRYGLEIASFLLGRGVKALVVACNTVSSLAMETLLHRSPVPLVGVVEPGARRAASLTRNRRVGVVGTSSTIASGAYPRALRRCRDDLVIFSKACPLFVPLVEEGWEDTEVARTVAARYLEDLSKDDVDTLVLGCTHYPLLRKVIASVMGRDVLLVDSAEETAAVFAAMLRDEGLIEGGPRPGDRHPVTYFVTDTPDPFVRVGERFLDERIDEVQRVDLATGK